MQSIIQSKLIDTTVGGTSAGLAILGNWVYSAQAESAESSDALDDPYNEDITLTGAFLRINYLETVITDTHFFERNRMGRLLTFVARIVQDSSAVDVPIVRGVGVDEPAGLIINATTGHARAVGSGNVYICASVRGEDPDVCEPSTPLTFTNVSCTRLSANAGDTYNFSIFEAESGGVSYTDNIMGGKFVSNPYGI